MPSGGDGLYYLYVNLYAAEQRYTVFTVRVNEVAVCEARADQDHASGDDNGTPSCGAVATLVKGKKVLLGTKCYYKSSYQIELSHA